MARYRLTMRTSRPPGVIRASCSPMASSSTERARVGDADGLGGSGGATYGSSSEMSWAEGGRRRRECDVK